MKPEIIFFDIDDTLSRGGKIAEQSVAVLQQLTKQTSIKLVIATGRPLPMMPADILELYEQDVFSAIISTNGQYAFDKDGLICAYPLDINQSQQIVDICTSEDLVYKFECDKKMAWSENAYAKQWLKDFIESNENYIIDAEYYKKTDIYQCSIFYDGVNKPLQNVDFTKYGLKLVFWSSMGADILPVEASKARAIKDVCTRYGVDIAHTMAFGDGNNDIEMFEAVGCGFAMGDAVEPLKAVSSLVTGTIEENGIYDALVAKQVL